MSDGFGSPEEIARQARESGVSLVLLTDHGNPNIAASTFREVVDGVTIVGGSEEKLPDGRLTFFGAREASSLPVSTFPPQAINEARASGAFPIVAYAEDSLYGWHYWEPDLSPGGIEVSNFFTCLRGISTSDRIFLALYYPFSHYYFLKNVCYPSQAFARWDDLLQRGKTWGFVATDAHGGFRWKKILAAKVPSYADTFSLAGIGINRKYAAQPELAIRSGDFFSCIRGAGEPALFDFTASNGIATFPTGSVAPGHSDLHVGIEVSRWSPRLVLRKNGHIERIADSNRIEIQGADSGIYRVEVYLLNHPLLPATVPWIVSNPIFIGRPPLPVPPTELYSRTVASAPKAGSRSSLAHY
jgi:hypothetical protein